MWRADGQILVKQYAGQPANIIWFFIGTKKNVLTYNHATQKIELKEKTHKGNILASFDNSSSYQNIITIFENL